MDFLDSYFTHSLIADSNTPNKLDPSCVKTEVICDEDISNSFNDHSIFSPSNFQEEMLTNSVTVQGNPIKCTNCDFTALLPGRVHSKEEFQLHIYAR